MHTTPVAVIGAGQAGLAVSRLLTDTGVDHVVLERGRTAERWRAHPWETLRLLTPNWMSRLPGWHYTGPDPAGFMPVTHVAAYLTAYAAASRAPIVHEAEVESVRIAGNGFLVVTTAGRWIADSVIVATGWCDQPIVPAAASELDPELAQQTAATFRNPAELPDGGVLVVGASASGVQLADEIAGSGRPVSLAVGSHSRLPRRYRGMDILWWLDAMGVLDRGVPVHLAPQRSAPEPSLQLVGRPDGRDVDLPSLQDRGVRLVGRLQGGEGTRLRFAADLAETTARADERLTGLLARIDAYARAVGLDDEIEPRRDMPAIRSTEPTTEMDLAAAGIRSIVWAVGYRRSYPWLHVPVLDAAGEIRHVAGTTTAPGLHVVGMRMQTRRNSTFIDGVRHDAAAVVARVLADLRAGTTEFSVPEVRAA